MLAWLAGLALVLGGLPDTVSKDDLRRQSPARTKRQLRDQLWSIFRAPDERRKAPARRPLSDVWLNTRAYETLVPGLCRMDTLTLRFAPVEDAPEPRDALTPVRAYGFDAGSRFLFLRPPTQFHADAVNYRDPRAPWSASCTRLSPDDAEWISAPDAEAAVDGYRAGQLAATALRKGALHIDVCTRGDKASAVVASCEAVVAVLGEQGPSGIERCEAKSGAECFLLSGIADTQVRVEVVRYPDLYRTASRSEAAAGTVVRLEIDYQIVLWHQRVD